jgi:selenocysteine lyase/cysteine desulfurase
MARTGLLLSLAAVAGSASISSSSPSSISAPSTSTTTSSTSSSPFGHALRADFFFASNYTQFNHGAYGGTPRPVVAAQYTYVARMEADTESWMNGANGYRACILAARQAIAGMINVSNYNDTVLVDNASEGINSVIRNMEPPLGPDEVILDLSTVYAPFAGLFTWMGSRNGVSVITAPITFPVTGAESFLAPVRALLQANASSLNIRVALISHITAYPSTVAPVRELVELLHSYSIPVIVDGAHALGNIQIDVGGMGDPEYYFANAHKWLFAPKSAAILYVRRDRQLPHVPAPAVVDNPETQDFPDRYIWTGTRDRSAYCAIMDALAYRQTLGGEAAVMAYTQGLAQQAGVFLAANWSTQLLHPLNASTSMISIQVPTDNNTACGMAAGQLKATYGYNMPASASVGDIACYWRLSAQVYHEMSDFQNLAVYTVQLLKNLGAHVENMAGRARTRVESLAGSGGGA